MYVMGISVPVKKAELTARGIFSYCGKKNYYKYKKGLGNAHPAF
jgi:hypothetical protein